MDTTGGLLEYYVGLTYIGKIRCEILDRTIGYNGRQSHKASDDITLGKKKIKAGTEYYTVYYPLNEGR